MKFVYGQQWSSFLFHIVYVYLGIVNILYIHLVCACFVFYCGGGRGAGGSGDFLNCCCSGKGFDRHLSATYQLRLRSYILMVIFL